MTERENIVFNTCHDEKGSIAYIYVKKRLNCLNAQGLERALNEFSREKRNYIELKIDFSEAEFYRIPENHPTSSLDTSVAAILLRFLKESKDRNISMEVIMTPHQKKLLELCRIGNYFKIRQVEYAGK